MKQVRRNHKRLLPLAGLLLFGIAAHAQQDVSGKYIAYNADTSNLLILRLSKDSMGYRGTYDLPLGGVMNAAAKNIRLRHDTLNIYLPQPVGAIVSTLVSGNGRLTETIWKLNGQTTKLKVKPLMRLQTPQPPVPYLSDSVEYDNTDKTVHLGATFTRPKAHNKKFAVAILITGSGRQDRDEAIFEHRPFAVIADYLTRNGIAVLRVDDRTMGKSRGDVMKATSADYAQDVLTSLRYLKTLSDVDTMQIGLIGHSEGGIISAISYTEWPHFAFIISLAGTGVPGSAILLRQQTDPVKGQVSQAAFDAYYRLVQQNFKIFDQYYRNDSLAVAALETNFDKWKQQYSDSILVPLNAKMVTGAMYAQQTKVQIINPWLKYFIHADPADYFKQVQCPVLALNGENDTQVAAVQNTTAIKNAVQKAGNNKVTVHIFPELNHLFQHCKSGQLKEYPMIEETFSTEVLATMKNWLQKIQIMK